MFVVHSLDEIVHREEMKYYHKNDGVDIAKFSDIYKIDDSHRE